MATHQGVTSWAQPDGNLKNVNLSGKPNSAVTKLELSFIGTCTDRRRNFASESGSVRKFIRVSQSASTYFSFNWNLLCCTSAARRLISSAALSIQLASSRVPRHSRIYLSISRRPDRVGPLIPRSSHRRVSAIQQDNKSVRIDVDWPSRALSFLTYTSVPFLMYALTFASGYEPLICSLTPGAWDGASDAGQQILDNRPLWCLHASCASLYVCSTILQFKFPGFLKQHASLHRVSGYVFLMCGSILSITGLIMAPRSEFPGFLPPCLALSFLWLVCGGMAIQTIKRGLWKEHERWVVRTTAAGYASILSRPAIALVHFLTGNTYRASGTPGLWLAILVAMTGAELLLTHFELQNAFLTSSRKNLESGSDKASPQGIRIDKVE